MSLSALMAFVAVLTVALAVPGPDLVLVVQSSTHSVRRGLSAAGGIIVGLCLHAALAIAGLAALLAALPGSLDALRLLGAGVLLWLGVQMIRSCRSSNVNEPMQSESRTFLRGFLTNATNPKALLFFAAVLPQFIGTGPGTAIRTAVLAGTVVIGAVLWWGGTITIIRIVRLGSTERSRRITTLIGGISLIVIAFVLGLQR